MLTPQPAADPETPPRRVSRPDEPDGPAPADLQALDAAVQACRRCPLWRDATQGVCGEGPRSAEIMIVGEQPGDQEDRAGRPFVGPAGRVLDDALAEAGIDRRDIFVTNAVKHFKHEPRGKRRLHRTPSVAETRACRWWLDQERRLVRPRVILAMGATAALGILGRRASVTRERTTPVTLPDGTIVALTVHPSYLLRLRGEDRTRERALFTADLRRLAAL